MSRATSKAAIPLSIAVIGAGKIGSTFAYQLARAGHQVTVVARPGSPRLQQLQRDRAIALTTGERAPVQVTGTLDEQSPYDLIVVTTLAHQVEALLPALQRSQARCVHFMFVTFEPERLSTALGEARCTFGMPFVMATLDSEGRLKSRITSTQKTLHSDRRWVALFQGAGLPSALEPNMPLWLRCHTPLCTAFESIAVAGQRRGRGASWADAMTVARGLHGGFAIARALGYRLYPASKSIMNSLPNVLLAPVLWSFSRVTSFRELLATGLNESRALIDTMAAAAAKLRPAVPNAVQAVLAMKP